ncbi:integrase core domain-containing protein, partial [Streptomyces virginiae]
EWAYQQPYTSDHERMEAFTDWLHWYNYHRPHTGIAGHTPASRGTNLSGQHT